MFENPSCCSTKVRDVLKNSHSIGNRCWYNVDFFPKECVDFDGGGKCPNGFCRYCNRVFDNNTIPNMSHLKHLHLVFILFYHDSEPFCREVTLLHSLDFLKPGLGRGHPTKKSGDFVQPLTGSMKGRWRGIHPAGQPPRASEVPCPQFPGLSSAEEIKRLICFKGILKETIFFFTH